MAGAVTRCTHGEERTTLLRGTLLTPLRLGRTLVKVMLTEKSIRFGWRCDSCGELTSDLQEGWVEWLAAEDAEGKPKVGGLRLVHGSQHAPRMPGAVRVPVQRA